MIYQQTSGSSPDEIFDENGQGGPSAWGLSWGFSWGNSWGFVRVADPFRNSIGTNPDIIYEEN